MKDTKPKPQGTPSTTRVRSVDTKVCASMVLVTLAIGFAIGGGWMIVSTYEQFRGRTDLDMPDWFVINFDLSVKVFALGAAGGICLLVAAGLFLTGTWKSGRIMRAVFSVLWLSAAAALCLVMASRIPL